MRNDFIVDKILPSREIHLLGGPSGAGKTTLLFQILESWASGGEVFGCKSYPVPFCYVACDRGAASINRTLDRIHCSVDIPRISIVGQKNVPEGHLLEYIIDKARELVPDCRFLIIDAIGRLCPGGKLNDYHTVANFLSHANGLCAETDITILGLGHSTKTREGEEFKEPRQKFLGSVAWGGFCDTMIYVDPVNPGDAEDPHRTVMVLPRNAQGKNYAYAFSNQGRLVEESSIEGDVSQMSIDLAMYPSGKLLSTSEVLSWAEAHRISRRSAFRWLDDQADRGTVERVKRGVFRKPSIA